MDMVLNRLSVFFAKPSQPSKGSAPKVQCPERSRRWAPILIEVSRQKFSSVVSCLYLNRPRGLPNLSCARHRRVERT